MESHPGVGRSQVWWRIVGVVGTWGVDQHHHCRWASEQAKARELGDVVEFARDLKLL